MEKRYVVIRLEITIETDGDDQTYHCVNSGMSEIKIREPNGCDVISNGRASPGNETHAPLYKAQASLRRLGMKTDEQNFN